MAAKPTYLVAPNFDYKPYVGPIRMGSIIFNPTRPDRVPNFVSEEELASSYPEIQKSSHEGHDIVRAGSGSSDAAIFAKFMSTASGEIAGHRMSAGTKKYSMDQLRTEYFLVDPDIAVIQRRIEASSDISTFMKGTLLRRPPVYMVSGIKIAHGLRVLHERAKAVGARVSGSASAPTPAGPLELGGHVNGDEGGNDRDEYHIPGDIVFAYKLLVIEYEGWRVKKLKKDEYESKDGFQGMSKKRDAEEDAPGALVVRAALPQDLNRLSRGADLSTVQTTDGNELSIIAFPRLD